MKKQISLVTVFVLCFLLYGQETGQITAEKNRTSGAFFLALGENILSNTLVYMANRYIAKESWAQVTSESIRENLRGPWEWDRDEYFTNQFGHPYQGSLYHTAARSNGFGFYPALLFDAFGSAYWELFYETNTPSINDLISTTLGGAALGEMFHRLYLEISHPLVAFAVSPVDAFNDLITRRRQYTRNIHSFRLAFGIGYIYAEQSVEQEQANEYVSLNTRHMVSADIAGTIIYGNPFVQQSRQPYEHFELFLYSSFGYSLWYNLKLLSDAYLFSFSVLDTETKQASTGLSLHYDLFADKQFDFFSQALDWTCKYRKQFTNGIEIEFKGHIGWTVFNADTFYIHNEYSTLRTTENNYGTGVNMKLIFAVKDRRWGALEMKTFVYEVFNIFKNEDKDSGRNLFMLINADYSFPIGKQISIGVAASMLRHRAHYDHLPDTRKWNNNVKLYIAWNW